MKANKLALIFLCGSIAALAGCDNGKDSSSSDTPPIDSGSSSSAEPSSDSSSTPVDHSSALQRAFQKNYSNYTATIGNIGSQGSFGESELAWYDYHVNGFDIIYDISGDEGLWDYYHDYEGKNYRYFDDATEPGGPAWLNSVYDGVSCTLSHFYWSFDVFLKNVVPADFTYVSGYYVFSNTAKFDDTVNTVFESFYDTEILDFYIQLDSNGYISVIKAFGEDAEEDLLEIKLTNFATTVVPSGATLPDAPNADTVKEYWQYKGWSGPQVHVYPKTIEIVPDASATKDGDTYVLEIEKGLKYTYTVTYDAPEGVEEARWIKESELTYVSSDEKVATVGLDKDYNRVIMAVAAGDCTVYIQGKTNPETGLAAKSNEIKIHVNGLADIDMTDAVYDITFDANSELGADPFASNSLNSSLPFSIKVNKGVNVVTAPSRSAIFGGKKTLVMKTGVQDTLNETFDGESTSSDAVSLFDFDDQQVSGIGFHYGSVYGNSFKPEYVSKVAIEAKNPSQTWAEAEVIDITDEVKENISSDNLHLIQKTFAPASQVRIVMRGSMIGDSMEMSMDKLVFAANDSCNDHFVADATPVTSVTISENSGATSVRLGKTLSFSAGILPSNATSKAVVWSVSDTNVATISSDGILTPVAVGTVKVKASSYHGATATPVESNEITITVKEAAAVADGLKGTWLEDDYPTANSFVIDGEKVKIKFANGDETELAFADINDDGYAVFGEYADKVTAGYFLAKVSSSETNKVEYIYNIKVGDNEHKANIYTQSSTLAKKAESVTLKASKTEIKVGAKTTLSADFGPKNCYNETWSVTSSNEDIVSISNDNGVVSAIGVAAGTATLTLTSEFGLKSTVDITVAEPQKVTGITVTLSATSVTKGSSVTATAVVAPDNADNKAVTWSTSNEEIATVNSKGVVTTLATGTVDIIATASDGSGIVGQATLTITEATSSFDGTYVASDTTGYGSELEITISDSGNTCEVYAIDSYGSGTLEGTITKKSSSGNAYVYEGQLEDSCAGGSIEATVTIDFDAMTVTIESTETDDMFMYDYSEFKNATITKQ